MMKKLKQRLQRRFYKIFTPKMKAKYQFGTPIIAVYRWNDYLVVVTKVDIYITEDGVNYVRANQINV